MEGEITNSFEQPLPTYTPEELADLRMRNRAAKGDPRVVEIIGMDNSPETRGKLAFVAGRFVEQYGISGSRNEAFRRDILGGRGRDWSPSVYAFDLDTKKVQQGHGEPEKEVSVLRVNTRNGIVGVNASTKALNEYNTAMETGLRAILNPPAPRE